MTDVSTRGSRPSPNRTPRRDEGLPNPLVDLAVARRNIDLTLLEVAARLDAGASPDTGAEPSAAPERPH
ncbi:MAG: hypothetical protein NVSMB12_07670 [Acidimicrobiales bacterium]